MSLQITSVHKLGLDSQRLERLKARMETAAAAGEAPGISIAIAREGRAATLCAGRMGPESKAAPL